MDTALDTAVRRENILASQKNILADIYMNKKEIYLWIYEKMDIT